MTSVVYFKFKNSISQDEVTFDGSVIQIGDVKRLVAIKRGLGPEGAAELTLSDPNTAEEYADDAKVVPRNTLVLVKRAPVAKFKPLLSGAADAAADAPAEPGAPAAAAAAAEAAAPDEFGGELYSEAPAGGEGDEEGKALQHLLHGSAATWQREVRQAAMRGRGRGRGGRGAGTPFDYRCPRSAPPSHCPPAAAQLFVFVVWLVVPYKDRHQTARFKLGGQPQGIPTFALCCPLRSPHPLQV